MFLRRSVVKRDKVNYLLAINSYLAYFIGSPLFLEMFIRSIYGQLHPNSSFIGWSCSFKGYALYINGSVYYLSFLLQSIYRLCRIKYRTRAAFQSFRLYTILTISQWLLAAILLLPSYFLGDFRYLPENYHCQLAPTDLRGSLLGLSLMFLIPFVLTLICYFYTMYYVRTQTAALIMINRYRNIHRDMIILSRLIILFVSITGVGIPHVLIPIVYTITGYFSPWLIPFAWLLTLFLLTAANIIQIFLNPNLRRICTQAPRINRVIRLNPIVHQ